MPTATDGVITFPQLFLRFLESTDYFCSEEFVNSVEWENEEKKASYRQRMEKKRQKQVACMPSPINTHCAFCGTPLSAGDQVVDRRKKGADAYASDGFTDVAWLKRPHKAYVCRACVLCSPYGRGEIPGSHFYLALDQDGQLIWDVNWDGTWWTLPTHRPLVAVTNRGKKQKQFYYRVEVSYDPAIVIVHYAEEKKNYVGYVDETQYALKAWDAWVHKQALGERLTELEVKRKAVEAFRMIAVEWMAKTNQRLVSAMGYCFKNNWVELVKNNQKGSMNNGK